MNKDLITCFEGLPDPRVERTKRYPLNEIIFLIIAGVVSGCEGWKSIRDFGMMKLDWLRKFLPYSEGIPVDDTIARVMRRLDTKAFQKCFIDWVNEVAERTDGDVVPIDGKTLRRSHNNKTGLPSIHMVSAWSSQNGLVLGQEKTEAKSNEITAIPKLLELLDLKGCIVTIDAMGCQTEIADKIVKKGADYVLAVKGNQGNLHEEIRDFFDICAKKNFENVTHDYYDEVDKGHGRIEHRESWSVDVETAQLSNKKRWKNIKSIGMIKSERDLGHKKTEDTRYYIASIGSDAKKLMHVVRKHWCVENNLHWTLDMTFREDESRIRTASSAENFAVMRHIALNLIKREQTVEASVKRKRLMAALDDNFREVIVRKAI